jgi:hypothetical protein
LYQHGSLAHLDLPQALLAEVVQVVEPVVDYFFAAAGSKVETDLQRSRIL